MRHPYYYKLNKVYNYCIACLICNYLLLLGTQILNNNDNKLSPSNNKHKSHLSRFFDTIEENPIYKNMTGDNSLYKNFKETNSSASSWALG